MEKRTERQVRFNSAKFTTREAEDNLYIEGYFAVFDKIYDVCPGGTESVARGTFTETLDRDIRALTDHVRHLVLGRTTAGTLELREDDTGLWGRITINRNDSDAMNLYHRVKRGDVSQCSFGFDIVDEETESRSDGTVHWTIRKVILYEVSVVTFPAYEDTAVIARSRDFAELKKRENEMWRERMKTRLKGE